MGISCVNAAAPDFQSALSPDFPSLSSLLEYKIQIQIQIDFIILLSNGYSGQKKLKVCLMSPEISESSAVCGILFYFIFFLLLWLFDICLVIL